MYLMIDNYDSFVYNLKAYFEELGRKILVRRSDQITMEEIEEMNPEGIILSPGPKRPWDAAVCGGSQEISGKDSDPRSLPWTSGAWILQRCVCPQGGASDAW